MNLKSQLSLLPLFFAITLQLHAVEQVFTDLNFAITPPENWNTLTNDTIGPGTFRVIYGAPNHDGLFFVIVDSRRIPTGPMDEKFIEDFDKGAEINSGEKRISGEFIQMDGVKAYERISNPRIQGRQMSGIQHMVLTSERFYNVQAVAVKNVTDDLEIQQALASFRFLTPAHEPTGSPHSSAYRAGYRLGYMVGRYGPLVVLFASALFVIIFMAVKSRNSKRPPLPPNA